MKITNRYIIYAKDTWYNGRALFMKRTGSAEYTYESEADEFSEIELSQKHFTKINDNKWIKDSPHAKYKWIAEKI